MSAFLFLFGMGFRRWSRQQSETKCEPQEPRNAEVGAVCSLYHDVLKDLPKTVRKKGLELPVGGYNGSDDVSNMPCTRPWSASGVDPKLPIYGQVHHGPAAPKVLGKHGVVMGIDIERRHVDAHESQ